MLIGWPSKVYAVLYSVWADRGLTWQSYSLKSLSALRGDVHSCGEVIDISEAIHDCVHHAAETDLFM